ncbi:MAG: allantoate amidohydrolase [Pirellulales bacterium]|nr:allantoate amidohydrolase [Pirellulales bacterium]
MTAASPRPVELAATRVMQRCEELALCTEEPGRVTRRYLCPAIREVHALIERWMTDAGMTVRVDAAGNIVGRRPGPPGAKTLLVGSHLDSVPNGGKYDGVLGVVLAIEAVAHLADALLPFHVDVIGFSEEEGVRFAQPYLGSAAVAGVFDPAWLERRDGAGATLRQAITTYGLDPAELPAAAYPIDAVLGYLEPHLEQGPVLEAAGRSVGVVTGIAGQSRLRVVFRGKADHAGTTPMDLRHDALAAAAELVLETNRLARATPELRATVGFIRAEPNASNVVPARVELSLDVRHLDDEVREAAVDALIACGEQIAHRGLVRFEVVDRHGHAATRVDPRLCELLRQACCECGYDPPALPSGAGHDAVVLAKRFPTAMLFLRHPGGVSHHPDERADVADVAAAILVLRRFILNLAAAPLA